MEKRTYYINGNTVRELEEATPVRREHRTRREIEEAQRRKNRRNAARRNRERNMSMSTAYVVFLSVCIIASAIAAFSLIQIRSSVTQQMKEVANIESQAADLKAENDARYKEITTSVDLNYIKDYAINQLGMTHATNDQIVYYTVDNDNYMDQYSDIPQ